MLQNDIATPILAGEFGRGCVVYAPGGGAGTGARSVQFPGR